MKQEGQTLMATDSGWWFTWVHGTILATLCVFRNVHKIKALKL